MFSKSIFQPIEHCRKRQHAQKRLVELFISCANPPEAFYPLEEVFNSVTGCVSAFAIGRRISSIAAGRDARFRTLLSDFLSKFVRVVAFISNQINLCGKDDFFCSIQISGIAGREAQLQHSTATIDQSRDLAVQPALGSTDRLILLAALRIGSVLVNFDVSRVDQSPFSFGALSQSIKNRGPKTNFGPPSKACVNTLPWPEAGGQISPGASRAHYINHCLDHAPMTCGRSPSGEKICRYR